MTRLSDQDKSRAHELSELLREPDPTSHWPPFLERMRELLDAERVVLYSIRVNAKGYALEYGYWSGFSRTSRQMNELTSELLAGVSRPWALFDPVVPQTLQRNRAVLLPAPRSWGGQKGMRLLRELGHDSAHVTKLVARMERLNATALVKLELADMHICRALVCEGEQLLAFVGAYRPRAFGERERLLLRSLLPQLRERLRGERLAADAPMYAAAAQALIETLDQPCLLLTAEGRVELANAAGWAMIRAEVDLLAELRRAPRTARSQRFTLHPLSASSMPGHYLVRERPKKKDPSARLHKLSRMWHLTEKEAAVMVNVALGRSNKEIAAVLGSQLRTVEFHLTRLFEKAGVDGRSALIARFWSS
jgi:DNA-binding CsgD family transcriptional regulator